MDKKTTILLGLGGAALIGGLLYYFRAKKLQTDVISALKIDLQNAGIQLPIQTPVSGTQNARPTPTPKPTLTARPISRPIQTGQSQQVGNEVKPPRFGEYGQQSQTYGQIGQDFGQGTTRSEYNIFDSGASGYGGNVLYDTAAAGYGGNVLYDTASGGYGGDVIFDTGNTQYGGVLLADTAEPCKPSYGTGDWVVSGNQCLGN